VATVQVELGDLIHVDVSPETGQLMFLKRTAGSLISGMRAAKVEAESAVNRRSIGFGVMAPQEAVTCVSTL
jgi:hypothetical protein